MVDNPAVLGLHPTIAGRSAAVSRSKEIRCSAPSVRIDQSMSRTQKRKRDLDRVLRQARSDYARYVGTEALFACQRAADVQVNADELAFQIVHQVEELWMKLAAHTLIDLSEGLRSGVSAPAILRGFARLDALLKLMANQLAVLDTMTPAAYAEIRPGLGQGSGQDSPGYCALIEHAQALWPAFQACFPSSAGASPDDIYRHTDTVAFAIAEALIELDIGLARFRHAHLQLVDRMIGLDSQSLKGLPAGALAAGVDRRLFGELWAARGTVRGASPQGVARAGDSEQEGAVEPRTRARRDVFTHTDWQ
jgi:tryptophan 2,3-dioxygenase